jgi:hypothetical protein
MNDVFRQRQSIIFSGILTLVMAILSDGDNRDKVVEQLRNLADEMFPGTSKAREERESRLANILKTQAEKTLTVEQLFEGADDG